MVNLSSIGGCCIIIKHHSLYTAPVMVNSSSISGCGVLIQHHSLYIATVMLRVSMFIVRSLAWIQFTTSGAAYWWHCSQFAWGPQKIHGDLISSEMGTQWGPSTAEMGTQTTYIWKIDRNEVIRWNNEFFSETHSHWQTGMGFIKIFCVFTSN